MAEAGDASLYERIGRRLAAGRTPRVEASDPWAALAERVDAAQFRPRLAPDVEVKSFALGSGGSYTMLGNPRDLVHVRLQPGEEELVALMDGTRTVRQLVVDRLEGSGELDLSGVADLVEELRRGNFLTLRFVDVGAAVRRRLDTSNPLARAVRDFVKTLSIEWEDAHRFVAGAYRSGLRFVFLRPIAWLLGLVAVVGLVAFGAVYASGRFDFTGRSALIESLILIAMNYFLTFAHELAHALVLVRYGRRVKSAGFMIYFGSPAFFVDVSDALMLERRQRIMQSFAGPYAEMMIAGAASIVALAFPNGAGSGLLYRFALLNYFVIFLNLVPMLELDGYWILSDALQSPDLRPHSLAFVRYDLWRKLRRGERFTRREVGLALYGTLGVAFTIFAIGISVFFWREVFGGLISALWQHGISGRVLLVVLTLFVAGPLVRSGIDVARSFGRAVARVVARLRFRLERGWRVDAAELIDDLPIFDDVPEDVLSDLAGRVRLCRVASGKPIVRQGERATELFVVRRGTLEIVEEDERSGVERVLRIVGRGESFGELGVATAAPRAATVRALTEAELFEIDKSTFDRLLAQSLRLPEFGPTLQRVNEVRSLPPFASLEPDEGAELLNSGSWVSFAPSDVIVREGEPGDAFFALGAGQVEVFEHGRPIRTMGAGSHFGELALLHDVPRTASVVAKTPVRAFRLERTGFDRLLASSFRKGTIKPVIADRSWHH
jgi:CRP-like cAMP-binding protein/Zn-dependent protease